MRSEERGARSEKPAACGLAENPRALFAQTTPRADAQRLASSTRPSPLAPRPSGVTLVELLIVITIIALLGTAILGVASVATNSAREARTQTMIARLHPLLMQHYDSYKVRRVRLNQNVQGEINARLADPTLARSRGKALATARLYALRELMLMEMPDRWSDVVLGDALSVSPGDPWCQPLYCAERSGLSSLYRRQYDRIIAGTNSLTGLPNTQEEILQNQSAECLYLTIMYACGDGEARGLFSETDIGDTDGDGAPEFLDSWGNPISFIRWAPAFESDAQLNYPKLATMDSIQEQEQAIAADRDPFDMFRVEATAFRLVPLIYSAGGDEEFGIIGDENSSVPWFNGQSQKFSFAGANMTPILSPFAQANGATRYYHYSDYTFSLGQFPIGLGHAFNPDEATDNIHNHLIGTR